MFHIYLPFDDKELQHGASHYSGVANIFTHGASCDLSGIGEGDILYVFAHGRYSTGSQIVGTVKGVFGERTSRKTASEVAGELVKHKLPKTFKDLRALVCWGGYVGGTTSWKSKTEAHTLKRNAADAPFAGQLCSSLTEKGFRRITVTGYTGTVAFVGANSPAHLSDVKIKQGTAASGWASGGRLGDANVFDERSMPTTRARSGMSEQAGTNRTLNNDNRTVWY